MITLFVIIVVILAFCGFFSGDKTRAKQREAWHHHNEQARMHPTLYRDVKPPPPHLGY